MHYKELNDIPLYNSWKEIKYIDKGWSLDKKYYIKDINDNEFLLRISDISKFNEKKEEFQIVKNIYSLDLNMNKPFSFGVCNKGKLCYMILSWVTGEQVELVLPLLDDSESYDLGFKAGTMLKKIHSDIEVCEELDWEAYYTKKISDRINIFKNCGVDNFKVDSMIEYLKNNLHLLKNRNVCQHHGDFHIGNLIVDNKLKLSIIDFNRVKVGDPFYEFNRLSISSRISNAFASGQINGYFNNKVPKDFFEYLKFYTTSVLIGAIPWALTFSDKDVEFALENINNVYQEYNKLKEIIPNWYQSV